MTKKETADRTARLKILKAITVGKRIAEEESIELQKYFLDTSAWEQLSSDNVDIVFGSKGFGKSALYILLLENRAHFTARNIHIVAGENPAGTAVFKSLQKQLPALTEADLLIFWRGFILALAGAKLQELGLDNVNGVFDELKRIGLIPYKGLDGAFNQALGFFRDFPQRIELEASAEVSETGLVSPTMRARLKGQTQETFAVEYLNKLLSDIESSLTKGGKDIWIALDRLDVAFEQDVELEARALRALFRVYSDFRAFRHLRLKIFIRDDLWTRITTESGFREASHIVRTLTLKWDSPSLLNLIIKRLINSDEVLDWFEADRADVLSDFSKQQALFYRIFPDQVEAGKKRRKTWDWILNRIQDGNDRVAPRELIHLIDASRLNAIKFLERGVQSVPLIPPLAIREALQEVSVAKLELAVYQEYPKLKPYLEKLRKKKTEYNVKALVRILGCSQGEVEKVVKELVALGILKTKDETYWVPFLYRDALQLVQGKIAK